jgi:hypothetical protein
MSGHREQQVEAVMDALKVPGMFAGPLPAFSSIESHLRWRAIAVLTALDGVALQTAQES